MSARSSGCEQTVGKTVDDLWVQKAQCRSVPTQVMFPDLMDRSAILRAEAVCGGCPVIMECGLAGVDEHDGVWGGRIHKPRSPGRKKPRYAPDPETGRVELVTPTPALTKGEPVRIMAATG